MSSDSSEDEDLNKFREAADPQFLNDSMFQKDNSKIETKRPEVKKLPSQRRNFDEDKQFKLFRVTPEFRSHVGKHLSAMLKRRSQNELIQHEDRLECNREYKPPKRAIRLLRHWPRVKLEENAQEPMETANVDENLIVDIEALCRVCPAVHKRTKLLKSTKKSRPYRTSQNDQFNSHITNELRDQIAAHFSKMMGEYLKLTLVENKTPIEYVLSPTHQESGIKLFRNSAGFVNTEQTVEQPAKRVKIDKISLKDIEAQSKLVAVSPEDILSRKETKTWSNRSKAPIYNYRKIDGKLVLQEEKFK